MGANDNMNADQKNIFQWTKKDEKLDVKEETVLHPLFKSLLDLWKDNKSGGWGKALVRIKFETHEFSHCLLKHS